MLDSHGDLPPPWVKYPEYDRYTIGWRMGAGEGYLMAWDTFLETLDHSFDTRLSYLRRHAPAPYIFADWVYDVLYPNASAIENDEAQEYYEILTPQQVKQLADLNLVASDAAYPIWLKQKQTTIWPWSFGYSSDPLDLAKRATRGLWFTFRQIYDRNKVSEFLTTDIPADWTFCIPAFKKQSTVNYLDLTQGLQSLTYMMATGTIHPPWVLGLTLDSFTDSFEDTMGYVDAFLLFLMNCIDDSIYLDNLLVQEHTPRLWQNWLRETLRLLP